ncbi:MAG: hypothetical protein RLZZ267_522 [Bacillota bacterium]
MFLAETTTTFSGFDIFMIVFTVLIAIGLYRLLKFKPLNKFAIGFTAIALAVFLYSDYLMVLNWLGKLQ